MWNILIVIIIAVVIWSLNPLIGTEMKPSAGVDKKTQSEVNKVVNEATQQVDYARQMQQQERQAIEQSQQ